MKISRRDFIRLSGSGALFAGFGQSGLLSGWTRALAVPRSSPFYEQLSSDEFPFPFDQAAFEAAERIAYVRGDPAASVR